ncbi:MAG: antibiotic biosynthesis monooxygenase [Ruminococcaceae bacterium]|nr:antibiotic biosynthesis monooxygenase [Oscillospiraceae bacterium]
MVVKFVTMVIKPEKRDLFIDATRENQTNSQLEEGVAIFDFYQAKDDPNKFILYESYYSEKGMEIHMTTQHYKKWKEAVDDCFAAPLERVYFGDVVKDINDIQAQVCPT